LQEIEMFHKILVALDNSEIRRQVFRKALDLTKAEQASLMLMHVLSVDDPNYPQIPVGVCENYLGSTDTKSDVKSCEGFYKQWHLYEHDQLESLQFQQDMALAAGVQTELRLIKGVPGMEICNLALAWEADLIVLGRREYSGLKAMQLGNVSTYVLRHAPCAVLIAQGTLNLPKTKPPLPQPHSMSETPYQLT
jgi:nucleotide-binding universal stress UspA family protein